MIFNLTVNHKGSYTTLVYYDLLDTVKPYKHKCFNDMLKDALSVLKSNGFYVGKNNDFGIDWYDIQCINLDNPTKITKHGLNNG